VSVPKPKFLSLCCELIEDMLALRVVRLLVTQQILKSNAPVCSDLSMRHGARFEQFNKEWPRRVKRSI